MRPFICLLMLCLIVGQAHAMEWLCPQRIETDQTLESDPASWTVGTHQFPSLLKRVHLYDGPPDQLASLVADNKTSTDGVYVYTLDNENPRNYWIACVYSNTRLTLSTPLPAGITVCRVTADNKIFCE